MMSYSTSYSGLGMVFHVVGLLYFLGLLYVSSIIIYRLYFHPLSKYPGPFLAKITDVHQCYHAWKGDRHLEYWRQHERYGKFVRFGPNSLSINSNTALHTIYGFRSNVRKSEFYSVFPATPQSTNTHNTIDKQVHARKRRVLSHAFSDAAMKGMEKYILQNIRTFCDGIGRTIDHREGEKEDHNGGWSSKGQNIADWANYLTFDIMGDLCFGKAFGMLDHPTNRFAIDLIGNAAHRHLICGTFPLLHRWHLDRFLFPHIAAGRARYMAYSKAQAVERTQMSADKSDRKDFFYYLLKAKDPETGLGFSMQELWGESNLLIIAGSDTTSTALASAIFYLVHNLTCLSKATAEVRNSFTDVEVIKPGEQLNNCHYLRAVIDEGMRLSPPVGGLLPREVLPGGLTIDDQPIPERAVVGVPHYAIHHNPSYFPDPFGFHPERWLVASKNERGEWSEGATKEEIDRARSAFAPFSLGPRGCIGKGMAYNELTTSLARLLWLFDMRLATEREGGGPLGEGREGLEWGRQRKGEYQLRDSFTSLKDGPVVAFRKRRE